jgi:hypothetical protein
MIHTIRVRTNQGPDNLGLGVLHDIKFFAKNNFVEKVETAKVYRLEGITEKQAKLLAEKLLAESINQEYSINKTLFNSTSKIVEITYKPGFQFHNQLNLS